MSSIYCLCSYNSILVYIASFFQLCSEKTLACVLINSKKKKNLSFCTVVTGNNFGLFKHLILSSVYITFHLSCLCIHKMPNLFNYVFFFFNPLRTHEESVYITIQGSTAEKFCWINQKEHFPGSIFASVIAAKTRKPVILLNSNKDAIGQPSLLPLTALALNELVKDHGM